MLRPETWVTSWTSDCVRGARRVFQSSAAINCEGKRHDHVLPSPRRERVQDAAYRRHRQTWFTSFRRFLSRGTYVRDWLSRIRRNETSSLKTQIREALAAAILEGTLSETTPVPSPRRMAEKLGVSRNTIVLAYQGLLEDGYLIARERSGYYVSSRTLAASPQYKLPLPQPRLAPAKRARDHSALWRSRLRAKPAQFATTINLPEWAHRLPVHARAGRVQTLSARRMARVRQAGARQARVCSAHGRELGRRRSAARRAAPAAHPAAARNLCIGKPDSGHHGRPERSVSGLRLAR